MERTCRKIIKRTGEMRFFLFLVFFSFSFYGFSQDINLFEEIEGKDLSEKKTIIFNLLPVFPDKGLFFPQLPEIKLEEEIEKETQLIKEIKVKEEEIEKEGKKFFLIFKFGSFETKSFDMNYKEKEFNLELSAFYTGGYRENSQFLNYKLFFSLNKDKFFSNFYLSIGNMELPGPSINPFNLERDWIYLNWDFSRNFKDLLFKFGHKYYLMDEKITNFLSLNIEKDLKDFKFITGVEAQILKNDNIFGISEDIIFEKEKFLVKLGLKFYNDEGVRILPNFLYKINENLSIFLNSEYINPDLWKDVIMYNWKEINKEKLSPEEIYKAGITLNFKNLYFEISHSYNDLYLWEYNDIIGLYTPYKENFWKTSFILNSEMAIKDNLKLFLNLQKDIFKKDIFYLPSEIFKAGLEFEDRGFIFRIYNSYTGERKFASGTLDGFSLLNFEMSYNYKNKFEIGGGIYNILNKEYEIVPYYPGEKRKFLIWIKF